jgi:hypothetical protein
MHRALLCLLLTIPSGLCAQNLSRLQSVHPGATIVVATLPGADRCQLLSVDTSALTCIDLNYGDRLVFPVRQINAVYEIRPRHPKHLAAWLATAAILAFAIAGGVTGDLGFYAIAFIISGIAVAASTHPLSPAPRPMPPFARPALWSENESGRLVYTRPPYPLPPP